MSKRLTRMRVAVAAAVALALGALGVTAAGAAPGLHGHAPGPQANGRTALAGSVPSWAKSANFKGVAAAGNDVGFRVYLGWRNESAVQALAKAVSDPSSSSYGHYLTPQQFRQQFAPTRQDVGAVESWLRSQGFQIDYVPLNNHYVEAQGTVAQANAAFGTTLNEYSYEGKTLMSPSSTLSIPSSLAGIVDGVIGLDDSMALVRPTDATPAASPSPGFRNAPRFSTTWASNVDTILSDTFPWTPQGYTPPMLRGAYGIPAVVDGKPAGSGQTVAIIDAYASPTIFQDAQQYSQRNDPSYPLQPSQFQQIVPPGIFHFPQNPAQGPQGWYGEETLDVEAVHAMAPGANILFVGAPNQYQDLDVALNHVVDRHLASIVTNSYGWIGEALPPGFIKPYEQIIEQGVVEGIGIYFSSGDEGDNSLLFGVPPAANWPASSPYVTAVGGTSLGIGLGRNSTYTYVGETGWSTAKLTLLYGPAGKARCWGGYNSSTEKWQCSDTSTFIYGSGGGVSSIFGEPDYQTNAGIDSSSFGFGYSGRVVPDVSMVGDPNTGMLVGQTQYFSDGSCPDGGTVCYGEYRIGGTSLSTPLFAGVMAIVDQARANASEQPLGFANYAIYDTYANEPSAFHDVNGTSIGGYSWVFRGDFFNSLNTTKTDQTVAPNGIVVSQRTLGFTGQKIQTGRGYDDMTGVGTPNGTTFLRALVAFSTSP